MAKAIGPKCNLDCEYCFYLEKDRLFSKNERFRMRDETLERFVKNYIEAQPSEQVSFAWQGGEPTLLGVNFFKKVVALQKKYAQGKQIENAFQTNGTLLNDEWAAFLSENGFLVGISIDGPETLHNTYRVKRNQSGSFRDVLHGVKFLQKHGVEWNSLTCIHKSNSEKPLEVYKFLKGIGSHFMQFIPIVERKPNPKANELGLELSTPPTLEGLEMQQEMTPWSVSPRAYGKFLTAIFDRWVRNDVGKIFVQIFDVSLSKWLGHPSGLCIFSETCGTAVALEHDGSIYSCDHYVYPDYRIGNINENSLASMLDSVFQNRFGQNKSDTLPQYCRDCVFRPACNGGCPKHRFLATEDGEPGLNYLCQSYFSFFKHADPYLRVMANLYRSGRAPALIMELLKKKRIPGLN